MTAPETLIERRGAAGLITLNRPQALNALTHGMVRAMAKALADWRDDPAVTAVIIRGAGEKAFCAGGDIRKVVEQIKAGETEAALEFWREEYTLNHAIKTYPKPFVALVDGIVMGGGVGVSLHGSHRVAGERFTFAMPETGIGFFPDVGGTYALPRLPAETGTFLALTAGRVKDMDALALGLATHLAKAADFGAITDAIAAGEAVDAVLARFARPAGPSAMLADAAWYAAHFTGDGVLDILARLDASAAKGDEAAATAAKTLRQRSPTSMMIALRQMRDGAKSDFAECMRIEMRIVSRIVKGHDFPEGVRAVIFDKDNAPVWKPARLEDVDPAAIAAHFAPLGEKELVLP